MATVPSLGPSAASTNNSSSLPTTVTNLGTQVLQVLLLLGGIIAVLYLIYAGYRYITSNGDPEKAKQARAGIIGAIIGVIIMVLAYTIVQFAINIGSGLFTIPS